MSPAVKVRLAPEYECHPVWRETDSGFDNIDPHRLPISAALADAIQAWSDEYQATYNRADPAASGFHDPTTQAAFDTAGETLAARLQRELGEGYQVSFYSLSSGWKAPRTTSARSSSTARAEVSPEMETLLRSPRARDRLEGLWCVEQRGGPLAAAREHLSDDAPYVYAHAGTGFIAEVRADALVVLQHLYRAAGRRPDFGPVTVRAAMPVDEAFTRAQEALARLSHEQRSTIAARVGQHLEQHVQPDPFEHRACRAYCTLQLLGLVEYQQQELDPVTLLTPLQAKVAASQSRSLRPRPHLRIDGPHGPVGWVYRRDGRWVEEFVEVPEATRARRLLRSFMRAERGELPRVVGAAEGRPLRNPDGSLQLDGVVPRDTPDPVEYLASLAAFCDGLLPCELVR